MLKLATSLGLEIIPCNQWAEAQAVLLCRDMQVTYSKLESAANAALLGKPVFCTNPDIIHPAAKGVHLETGSLLAVLQRVAPQMTLHVFGKPARRLAMRALQYLRVAPNEALFLGDNLDTDATCARLAGIPFLHVGGNSGHTLLQAMEEGKI